jgi:hypothetical protein
VTLRGQRRHLEAALARTCDNGTSRRPPPIGRGPADRIAAVVARHLPGGDLLRRMF